jgi:hypothetical protein
MRERPLSLKMLARCFSRDSASADSKLGSAGRADRPEGVLGAGRVAFVTPLVVRRSVSLGM